MLPKSTEITNIKRQDAPFTGFPVRGDTVSNEELASAIQKGEREHLLTLWEQVQRFAYSKARKWNRPGMEIEDFMQVAFLALLDAVASWKEGKGAFLTWYALHLCRTFYEASGQRTKREREDPIQNALSLDEPLNEEDFTLSDLLEDPDAEAEIGQVAEADFQRRRRAALRKALDRLNESQRQAVVLRYCYGLSMDETAERMHTTRAAARSAEQKGLRLLRHSINRELRLYL